MSVTVAEARKAIASFIKSNPTLTAKEVATHFSCNPATVYRLAKQAGITLPRPSRFDYNRMSPEAMAYIDFERDKQEGR